MPELGPETRTENCRCAKISTGRAPAAGEIKSAAAAAAAAAVAAAAAAAAAAPALAAVFVVLELPKSTSLHRSKIQMVCGALDHTSFRTRVALPQGYGPQDQQQGIHNRHAAGGSLSNICSPPALHRGVRVARDQRVADHGAVESAVRLVDGEGVKHTT